MRIAIVVLCIFLIIGLLVGISLFVEKAKENGDLPCSYYRYYQFNEGHLPFSMNTTKIYNKIIDCELITWEDEGLR